MKQKKDNIKPMEENEANDMEATQSTAMATGLQPILKWPGGKEKELKYILPNVPVFRRYYEPFVGGGSVFMSIRAQEYHINDFSSELVSLYHHIAHGDDAFFRYVEMMDMAWQNAARFFGANNILTDTYLMYRESRLTREGLKARIHDFCRTRQGHILDIIGEEFAALPCILPREMESNLFRKMTRMRELECTKHLLPEADLEANIETAIKSAVYMNYRHLYNSRDLWQQNETLHCALFFFMRNYAYSGMFRYSSKGDFNVPYGGMAYNSKLLAKKLCYYRSEELRRHFAGTAIFNLDFEDFLRVTQPGEDDFVFLDPPYDSEFCTYAQNAFTREDQTRLARYMIHECRAKWMMVIKDTDFIHDLYNRKGIRIRTFDKEYRVSFMNRNDKKATHLMITNY